MSFTREHKETIHVKGTCAHWTGVCADALQRAGFVVYDGVMTHHRIKAQYKGITIDGTIQLTLESVGMTGDDENIDITMRITADDGNPFAWFKDPCQRIRDAFMEELWRKRRRRRD